MKDIEKLVPQLQSGGMTRRRFISSALAMGMTLPAASLLATQALAATPKRGGHFRVGINFGSTDDSLDPGTYQDTYMQTVGFAFRNCLTELNNEDELVGELAESWEATPDATVWHFKLRKGVEFHNGKTLDSKDAAASIFHHIREDSTSVTKGALSSIVSVQPDGPDMVKVELAEGNVDFPYLMSDYHIGIMPASDEGVDWRSGVGTGGYIIDQYDPGVRTSLKRNPNYWKAGHAHFDSVEALVMRDAVARTSALTSGSIEAMNNVDLKTVNRLARIPNINIHETSGNLHFGYAMRCDTPPFDNLDVRLALKYAIDREEFLQKILFGHGYLGNDHSIGKANQFFNSELPQRMYDPDRAKFHLKQAGVSSLRVDLNAADTNFAAVDGAQLYSESAKKVGIDINVIRESMDGYWTKVWGVKGWAAEYWAGRVTEDWMLTLPYTQGTGWDRTRWYNDRFSALLKQARVEFDQEKRREMYYEIQQLCSDEDGAVIPAFGNYVFATSDKIASHRMSAAWDLDGIKSVERWWYA